MNRSVVLQSCDSIECCSCQDLEGPPCTGQSVGSISSPTAVMPTELCSTGSTAETACLMAEQGVQPVSLGQRVRLWHSRLGGEAQRLGTDSQRLGNEAQRLGGATFKAQVVPWRLS
jgi:hypothetical protein